MTSHKPNGTRGGGLAASHTLQWKHQILYAMMKLHGQDEVVNTVQKKYTKFGKRAGWDHAAAATEYAKDLLKETNPKLLNKFEDATEYRPSKQDHGIYTVELEGFTVTSWIKDFDYVQSNCG